MLRSFFKYLVCNVRQPIYQRTDYLWFMQFSLQYFTQRFSQARGKGFKGVFKILRAKELKLKGEKQLEFMIK